jgi:chaperonin GroES
LLGENKMKIRPLHDRVVIRREDEETTSKGGIVLPGSATEKPSEGEVIAVGSGKLLENGDVRAVDLKVGDKVLFGKYAGTEVKLDGEDIIVMREDDVMGVIQ